MLWNDDHEKIKKLEEESVSWRIKITVKSINTNNSFKEIKFKTFLEKIQLFIINKRTIYVTVR